jgi:hypothetical protein
MSAAAEGKARRARRRAIAHAADTRPCCMIERMEDTLASGAKPRPEGRVREGGWRPTCQDRGIALAAAEAA